MREGEPSPYLDRQAEEEQTSEKLADRTADLNERMVAALQHRSIDTARELIDKFQELWQEIGQEKWDETVAPNITTTVTAGESHIPMSREDNTRTTAEGTMKRLAAADFHGARIMLENLAIRN